MKDVEGQPDKREEEHLPRPSPLRGGEHCDLIIDGAFKKGIPSDIKVNYHALAGRTINPYYRALERVPCNMQGPPRPRGTAQKNAKARSRTPLRIMPNRTMSPTLS